MKIKAKEIIILLVLLLAYLILRQIAVGVEKQGNIFSTYNSLKQGSSLVYDTTKALGYNVSPYHDKIDENTTTNKTQVIILPQENLLTKTKMDSIMKWVYNGGTLIYGENEGTKYSVLDYVSNNDVVLTADYFKGYSYGLGEICLFNGEDLLNEQVMLNSEIIKSFDFILNSWGMDIYFNEYFHGYSNSERIIKHVPLWLKYGYIQFVIIAIFIILQKGKRYGKPLVHYELEERSENEYAKTLASIYNSSYKGEVVINNLYKVYINKCCKYFAYSEDYIKENILLLWEGKKLKHFHQLTEVQEMYKIENTETKKRKIKNKDIEKFAKNINKLESELKK